MSIVEILELLGGKTTLAYHLGLTESAVAQWQYRGIPEKHWARILEIAKKRLSVKDLYLANQQVRS